MISKELINTIEGKHLKSFLRIQQLSEIFEEDSSTTQADFIINEMSKNDIFKYDFNTFLNDYFQIVNNTKIYVYILNFQEINNISQFIESNTPLLKSDYSFSEGFSKIKNSVINSHHEFNNGTVTKSTINILLKNILTKSKGICLTASVTLNYEEGYATFAFPARILNNPDIKIKNVIKQTRNLLLNLFEQDNAELFSLKSHSDNVFLKNGLYKLYCEISKPIENELINSLPADINNKIIDLLKAVNLENDTNQSKLIKNALYQSLGDRDFQQNIENYQNGWIFWLSFSDKMGTSVNTRDTSHNPIYMTDIFWNIREYINNTINEVGYSLPIKQNEKTYESKATYSTFHNVLEISLYTLKLKNFEKSITSTIVSDYKKIIELRKEEFNDVERKIKTIL